MKVYKILFRDKTRNSRGIVKLLNIDEEAHLKNLKMIRRAEKEGKAEIIFGGYEEDKDYAGYGVRIMTRTGRFSEDYLREHWGSGKPITYRGKKYRVGQMSYGGYFLEPVMTKKEKQKYYGETKPLHPKTLWLERVEGRAHEYQIEE